MFGGVLLVMHSSLWGRGKSLLRFDCLLGAIHVAVGALRLFRTVPWVSLQCLNVAFPGGTQSLFHTTDERFRSLIGKRMVSHESQ